MKAPIACAWLFCLLGPAPAVLAQPVPGQDGTPRTRQAEWRLADVRRSTPSGPGRLKEVTGTLISDPVRREIRFETRGREVFVVPYDQIDVIHYEEAGYPRRLFRRSSFYLIVHYTDDTGQAAYETMRLVSGAGALAALDTLQQHTGRATDRSGDTESFLGIPIRADTGTRVVVTDQDGRTSKGVISRLSSTSLALDEAAGGTRVFDEADVRRIRLAFAPKHDALVDFGIGAGAGVAFTYLLASLGGCYNEGHTQDCHVFRHAVLAAGIVGGGTALIGTTVRALRYPFNHAYDVYQAAEGSASRPYSITLAPLVGQGRRGVLLVVEF